MHLSTDVVAILGFVALFVLMLLRVPVGMAMGLVGVSGFAYIVGGTAALKNVGLVTTRLGSGIPPLRTTREPEPSASSSVGR